MQKTRDGAAVSPQASGLAPINGVDLFYEVMGAGDPVVLVHCSWVDHTHWEQVAPRLAASSRVVVYDRRGHSQSGGATAGPGSFAEDADDLAGLIEYLDLGPVHVVGNSSGAIIALLLAVKHGDLVRSLAVHEPSLVGLLAADPAAAPMVKAISSALEDVGRRLAAGDSEGAAREFTDRVAFGPGTWDGRFTARLRETMVHNAATFLDELRQPGRLSVDAGALRQIAAPVLLTEGEQSPPFRSLINERLAAILTDAQRRIVPGVGHDPHVSAPDRYASLIAGFVSGQG